MVELVTPTESRKILQDKRKKCKFPVYISHFKKDLINKRGIFD